MSRWTVKRRSLGDLIRGRLAGVPFKPDLRCWKRFTPRDNVLRRLRFHNQTMTINSHPYSVAGGMCLPVDGYPTGVAPASVDQPDPQFNCYGVDVESYGLLLRCEYDDAEDLDYSVDDSLIGTPLDISTANSPGLLVPIDFDEDSPGTSCSRGAAGDYITSGGSLNTELEPPGPLTIDVTCAPSVRLAYDRVLYLHIKNIGAQGVSNIYSAPTTEADRIAQGFGIADAGLYLSLIHI